MNCRSSRRWPTQTQSSRQSDTAAKAINYNRKSQGLETSVSGVAVTLADWFSLSNWNCCVLFPPSSQTAPALVYSDHHLSAVWVHELYQTVRTLECQLTYWVSTTFTRLGFSSAHNEGEGEEWQSERAREWKREGGGCFCGWLKDENFPFHFLLEQSVSLHHILYLCKWKQTTWPPLTPSIYQSSCTVPLKYIAFFFSRCTRSCESVDTHRAVQLNWRMPFKLHFLNTSWHAGMWF